MTSSLSRILGDLVVLLRECGHPDRAAWIEERKVLLDHPNTTGDAREHVSDELHGIVLGMGGLMDLTLSPLPGSVHSPTAARQQLDTLADQLYELTR